MNAKAKQVVAFALMLAWGVTIISKGGLSTTRGVNL